MSKCVFLFMAVALLIAPSLTAQTQDNPALKPILNNFGARNYASGEVTKAELDLIIQAGIRAPSAGNRQPWHFTAVRDQALAKRVLPQTTDGNVLVIVSSTGDIQNSAVVLDCALAVQSVYLAAQALGLGSRIYTGPIANINANYKADLGLPGNYNAVALVRIGRLPAGIDAVSSASPRNDAGRLVTYK